jgi:hypothetical protein
MKLSLLILAMVMSINVFGNDNVIDIQNDYEATSDDGAVIISKALVIANDDQVSYGSCGVKLNWGDKDDVTTYLAHNNTEVLLMSSGWYTRIFIDDKTTITRIEFGEYEDITSNTGTIFDPHFMWQPEIITSKDANSCP